MKGRRRLRFLGESGAAATEFALVCLPIVVILFAIIQFGAALYTYNTMKNAAREGVRWYAVGAPNADLPAFGGNDKLAAEARAQDFLNPTWITANVNAWAFNNTGDPSLACPDDNPEPDCDVTVTITAPMGQAAIIDLLDLMTTNGFQLTAQATMRRED